MGVLGRLGKMASRNVVRQRDFHALNEKLDYNLLDLPRNYYAGLLTTRTDAQNITIAAGQARNTGDTANILVTSAIQKDISATWAAGTTNGGLDDTNFAINAGPSPDTWYHVFILGKADSSAYDAGFDTSISATNLLDDTAVTAAGFTTYRRVASIKMDDAAVPEEILDYTQVGPQFTPKVVETVVSDATLVDDTAETLVLTGCPIDHSVVAELNVRITDDGNAAVEVLFSSLTQTDVSPSLTTNALCNINFSAVNADDSRVGQIRLRTDTAASIRHRNQIGAGTVNSLAVACTSWVDDLGKFD
jgi:hypothetical protein